MDELARVGKVARAHNVLLVLDAMTGQEAVRVAQSFQEHVAFDGVVLTKLDGDARGGAALSVKAVTGRPIKLVSVGEKLDQLEYFHPDRMASRILGMGDVLSLSRRPSRRSRRTSRSRWRSGSARVSSPSTTSSRRSGCFGRWARSREC